MRIHTGPITDLRQAAQAWRYVWVFCLQCGHAAHKHPYDLAAAAQTVAFKGAAAKCRCTRCKAIDTVIFPSRKAIPLGIKN